MSYKNPLYSFFILKKKQLKLLGRQLCWHFEGLARNVTRQNDYPPLPVSEKCLEMYARHNRC